MARLIDLLPDVARQSAFGGSVFFIARDLPSQNLDQGRTGLGRDHAPGIAFVHAQITDQHRQDLIGSEVDAALVNNAKAVGIGIHAKANLRAGPDHGFLQ